MGDQVRIVGGYHDGIVGDHVADEGDVAVIEVDHGGAEPEEIRVLRKHVRPLAPIADLFDDPENVEEED